MNKILIFILICAGGSLALAHAQEEGSDNFDSYIESLPKRNPFKPLLPEKVIAPPVVETPKFPEPKPTPPRQVRSQHPFGDTPSGSAPKVALPTLVITGVIWDSDRPQAIINGQVVNEGDTVAEIKIVAIRKTGIDIIYQGQAMTLTP